MATDSGNIITNSNNLFNDGSNNAGISDNVTLKNRLLPLVESNDFDQLVKDRVKNRKEKDEYNIAKVRLQITKLENTLAAEIKRRITSQRQLERTCQEQIAAMEQRLMDRIERQSQHVTSLVTSLEEQMQELQKQVDRLYKDIPKSIELQAQRVSQELVRLSQDVQQEKQDRFSREGLILKQMQDYESSISDMIERERDQRKAKIDFLREILERNESGRVEAESRFATLIESEIAGLKSQLLKEIQERQVEDDAIVDAMNLYITKLQSTLHVITSDE